MLTLWNIYLNINIIQMNALNWYKIYMLKFYYSLIFEWLARCHQAWIVNKVDIWVSIYNVMNIFDLSLINECFIRIWGEF